MFLNTHGTEQEYPRIYRVLQRGSELHPVVKAPTRTSTAQVQQVKPGASDFSLSDLCSSPEPRPHSVLPAAEEDLEAHIFLQHETYKDIKCTAAEHS